MSDFSSLQRLAQIATRNLLGPFLSTAQREAAHEFTPLDPWIVEDGTYYVAEIDGSIRASGGWSRRSAMIHTSVDGPSSPEMDPAGPARIRAMYTDPSFARLGLARIILSTCELTARLSGHDRMELVATPVGELLYRSYGFETIETLQLSGSSDVTFQVTRMSKRTKHENASGPAMVSA